MKWLFSLFRRRTFSDLTPEQRCMARALSVATPNTNLRQAVLPDDWRPDHAARNGATAYVGRVIDERAKP